MVLKQVNAAINLCLNQNHLHESCMLLRTHINLIFHLTQLDSHNVSQMPAKLLHPLFAFSCPFFLSPSSTILWPSSLLSLTTYITPTIPPPHSPCHTVGYYLPYLGSRTLLPYVADRPSERPLQCFLIQKCH